MPALILERYRFSKEFKDQLLYVDVEITEGTYFKIISNFNTDTQIYKYNQNYIKSYASLLQKAIKLGQQKCKI